MTRAGLTMWDARAARRALGVAFLALVLAWLVTAATDEGDVTWAERAGRALPVAPICAAIGAWMALAPGRARGELRALEALGRSPWENARAAALGGAAVAAVAGAAIAWAPRVEVAGFYPEVGGGADVRFEGGAFVDRTSGWRIDADGALAPARAAPALRDARVPPHGRAAAGAATAAAGLALALLVGRRRRRGAWLGAAAFVCAVTILLFQAAAARRVSAMWAVAPPALLLAIAGARYREDRWQPK